MERNVGGFDRTWRLVGGALLAIVGVAALAGVVSLGTLPALLLALVGVVVFTTGVVRRCVINRVLGVDTSGSAVTDPEPIDEQPSKRAN